jgi:hypothetical protein
MGSSTLVDPELLKEADGLKDVELANSRNRLRNP